MAGEEAIWFEDLLVPIYRNGKIEDVYWTFSYSPVNDESGKIAGVLVTCTETTNLVIAKQKIEESERNLRSTILQAPVGIAILRGPQYITEIANDRSLELWNRRNEDVLNKPILEAMPELESQGIKDLLDHVYQTGEPFEASEFPVLLVREGKLATVFVNFVYQPLYGGDGSINKVLAITIGFDVTTQVIARKAIEENEERLNVVIRASELGTWELNLITDEATISDRYLEIFGYEKNGDLSHVMMVKHLHPDDADTRDTAFEEAMKTGVLSYEARVIWNDGTTHWISAKGKVFYDETGQAIRMIGTVEDITEAKDREQELKESEEKFRLLADSIPQLVWTADNQGNLNYFNEAVFEYSGLTAEQAGNGGWLNIVHPDEREENIKLWTEAVTIGKVFLI